MCAADTNLEDVDSFDGVLGTLEWGSKRVCRDFEAVFGWSEKWRKGEVEDIV